MAKGMKFGAGYQGTKVPPAIAAREKDLGYTLDSARYYMKWSEDLVDDEVRETLALGKDAIIALESFDPKGVSYKWLDVADGKYDTRLEAAAAELAALDPNGPRVWFQYHHEPEDDTADIAAQGNCGTSGEEFKVAFEYVRKFMRSHGVGKVVRIGPCFMGATWRGGKGGPAAWLPPNVDYIASDGYSRSQCERPKPKTRSFTDIFGTFLALADQLGKPCIINEWGIAENTTGEGMSKADNVTSGIKTAIAAPRLRLVSYSDVYSTNYSCPYFMDTTPESLQAFKDLKDDLGK
jgi:hypothetical protein